MIPNGIVIAAPMILSVEQTCFLLAAQTLINQLEALALLAVVFNLKVVLRHMDLLSLMDNQGHSPQRSVVTEYAAVADVV